MNTVYIKIFIIYGSQVCRDLAANIFLKQAFNNKLLNIFSDIMQTRDIKFINDIVEAD